MNTIERPRGIFITLVVLVVGLITVRANAAGGTYWLSQVPAYDWYHGCGPTAAGSVIGYWDVHGFGGLFDASGWDNVKLTDNVEDQITSPEHIAKYHPKPDDPNLPVPENTSIACWYQTSVDPLEHGISDGNLTDDAFEGYANYRGYTCNSWTESYGSFTWADLVGEIRRGRPMFFGVDTNGDGKANHAIPVFGYDDRGANGRWYACYTTSEGAESETVVWKQFRPMGNSWGVGLGAFVHISGGLNWSGDIAEDPTLWTNSTDAYVGNNSDGTLNITGGWEVSSDEAYIGYESGSTGEVTVDGAGSTWTNNDDLIIGIYGTGTLNITSGGTVEAAGNVSISTGSSLTLDGGTLSVGGTFTDDGDFNWAAGNLALDGGSWDAGSLDVSSDIAKTLALSNGGSFSSVDADIGDTSGSTGVVTVDGAGSTWTNSSNLCIGCEGNGTLIITDGGKVSAGAVYIGDTPRGNGRLSVLDSAVLEVAGELRVGSEGDIDLDNGSVSASTLNMFGVSSLTGNGTVTGRMGITSMGTTIKADGGPLTIGDPNTYAAFNYQGTLSVGAWAVALETKGFASLGPLTTIDGGTLQAVNGLYLRGGGTIAGHGSVVAPIAAAIGSTISATGDLVLGDATRYDGLFSDGLLHVNAHTVTLHDHNEVVLGSLTTIDGGTLTAPNSFLVLEGRNLTGRGFVTGNFKNQGSVIGDGTAANERIIFDSPWVVSGKGTFVNTLVLGTFAPGESPGVVTGTNQGFGGIVQIELGGLTPGFGNDKHDQIVDTGTILLFGSPTLEVLPWNNFLPQIGDEFTIMTWQESLDGAFGTVTVDPWFLAGGIDFDLQYISVTGEGGLVLQAVPEPVTLGLLALGGLALLKRRRKWAFPHP